MLTDENQETIDEENIVEEESIDADEVEAEEPSDALEMDLLEEELIEEPITETVTDTLTEEQQQLADELSLPVENPELMVIVPRAFSLNEYLTKKENGDTDLELNEDVTGLKYFVIGGSFIVKNNANRFFDTLTMDGYQTQVLFHPESRFNFVAYQGFQNFDNAVSYLMSIREEVNSEAWLFTLPTD